MPVADVASALGCPASTVEALVRVVTEGSEAVIDLLKSGTVDVATAKLVVQQPVEVQTAIVEAVQAVAAQAAASESGEIVMEEISQKPVARKTEGGKVKVSKTFVETARDAAKGKATTRDATRPGKAAKAAPESVPAAPAKGKPDALSIRAAALAAIPAADVINDKEYLRGVADAMSLLLGEAAPSHPAFALLMKRLARR